MNFSDVKLIKAKVLDTSGTISGQKGSEIMHNISPS